MSNDTRSELSNERVRKQYEEYCKRRELCKEFEIENEYEDITLEEFRDKYILNFKLSVDGSSQWNDSLDKFIDKLKSIDITPIKLPSDIHRPSDMYKMIEKKAYEDVEREHGGYFEKGNLEYIREYLDRVNEYIIEEVRNSMKK